MISDRRRFSLLLAVAALAASSAPAQSVGGCAAFHSNNIWNTPVDSLPLDANSSAYINTIGASNYLHPDFSSTGGGIPYTTVTGSQPRVPVVFGSPSESDPGPYPIPANAPVEAGGDRHVLVVDQTNCVLYELYAAYLQADGSWTAGSGAVFDLNSNILRPAWWTSADAAGLPILPGLVRYDEVMSGEILHAIRMTAPQTRNQFIWPARHRASSLTGTQYPPMGQRFRLKASFDETPYPFEVQVILRALKKYGAILADNGSPWYLTGVPDARWNDSNLHLLQQVFGSNMEAVDESALMASPDSAVVTGGPLALDGFFLADRQVSAGGSVPGEVILTAPAAAGGATVSLTTTQPNAATVPAFVTVPAGAVSAQTAVNTYAAAPSGFVSVLGSYLGITTPSAPLLVNGTSQASLAGLNLSAASVVGGKQVSAVVTLSAAAPAGGVTVTLSSSNPAAASVPASISVPAGVTSATATVTTYSQAATASVTISAALNGSSKTAVLSVVPAALSSLSVPSSVTGVKKVSGKVSLNGVAAAPLAIALASSNPAAASVPPSVTIPAGANSSSFSITTGKVSSTTSVTISASAGTVTKTATLTVKR